VESALGKEEGLTRREVSRIFQPAVENRCQNLSRR
jgi:hypothetical protein